MEVLSAPDDRLRSRPLASGASTCGSTCWTPPTRRCPQASAELGVHPLALEDSEEFSQRPKLDHYGDHLLLVFYGARLEDDGAISQVETHLIVGPLWLLTVRRHPCLSLDHLHDQAADPGRRPLDRLPRRRRADGLLLPGHARGRRADRPPRGGGARGQRHRRAPRHRRACAGRCSSSSARSPPSATCSTARSPSCEQLPGLGDVSQAYFRDVQDHLYRLAGPRRGPARPPDRHDPPERGHDQHAPGRGQRAAVADRHDLPAADRRGQLLRHELRLDGATGSTRCRGSWAWASVLPVGAAGCSCSCSSGGEASSD